MSVVIKKMLIFGNKNKNVMGFDNELAVSSDGHSIEAVGGMFSDERIGFIITMSTTGTVVAQISGDGENWTTTDYSVAVEETTSTHLFRGSIKGCYLRLYSSDGIITSAKTNFGG